MSNLDSENILIFFLFLFLLIAKFFELKMQQVKNTLKNLDPTFVKSNNVNFKNIWENFHFQSLFLL